MIAMILILIITVIIVLLFCYFFMNEDKCRKDLFGENKIKYAINDTISSLYKIRLNNQEEVNIFNTTKWYIKYTSHFPIIDCSNRDLYPIYAITYQKGYNYSYELIIVNERRFNTENVFDLTDNIKQCKQELMKKDNRKIIGYKCPIDLFDGSIKKGHLFIQGRFDHCKKSYWPLGIQTGAIPKEIVEAWEPVYEEDKIEIGGYEVCFIGTNNKYTIITTEVFLKSFWEAAKTISEHSKAKIMIGCNKQFNVSLETIEKILKKLE